MLKTTVYLPPDLKARLKQVAAERGKSEADMIRAALELYAVQRRPRPRYPLYTGPIDGTIAGRVDEILAEGFGRD